MTLTQWLATLANRLIQLEGKVNSMSSVDPNTITQFATDIATLKTQMTEIQAKVTELTSKVDNLNSGVVDPSTLPPLA